MELVPIVEIIQVHRVLRSGRVIPHPAISQDLLTRLVVVIIPAHGGVVFFDRLRGERLRIRFYPRFELRIGRLALFNIILHRLFLEPKVGAGHRVEPSADAGITGSKFARRFQRDFLPHAGQMQNAEWSGYAGADHWDIGITHNRIDG